MFDASEIMFLDQAVALGYLTPGQRERVLSWQPSLDPNVPATQVVQDYALMDEAEVEDVLRAIEAGVSDHGASSGHHDKSKTMALGMPRHQVEIERDPDTGKPVATSSAQLAELLDEHTHHGDSGEHISDDDVAKEIAKAIRGVLHEGRTPPPVHAEDQASGGEDWGYEEGEEAPQQAFPMPGQAHSQFPSADEVEQYEGYYYDETTGEYYPVDESHQQAAAGEEAWTPPAAQIASSRTEIEDLLADPKEESQDFKGGVGNLKELPDSKKSGKKSDKSSSKGKQKAGKR